MLLPRSHAWTRRQRLLIAVTVMLALVSFATLIYSYERYHRGSNDSVLFGTWQCAAGCYYPLYYRFDPDHNVEILDNEDKSISLKGRWYAGGDFIYLRFPEEELKRKRDILIWRIEDITPNELRARMWNDEPPRIYRRVDPASPHASNQPMKPTAPPRNKFSVFASDTLPWLISFSLGAMRHPGPISRRSASRLLLPAIFNRCIKSK